MIQLDVLYALTVSRQDGHYELTASSVGDPSTISGNWTFVSATDMEAKLFHLDVSAVDYDGAEELLKSTSPLPIGHPVKGSVLIKVMGAAHRPDPMLHIGKVSE